MDSRINQNLGREYDEEQTTVLTSPGTVRQMGNAAYGAGTPQQGYGYQYQGQYTNQYANQYQSQYTNQYANQYQRPQQNQNKPQNVQQNQYQYQNMQQSPQQTQQQYQNKPQNMQQSPQQTQQQYQSKPQSPQQTQHQYQNMHKDEKSSQPQQSSVSHRRSRILDSDSVNPGHVITLVGIALATVSVFLPSIEKVGEFMGRETINQMQYGFFYLFPLAMLLIATLMKRDVANVVISTILVGICVAVKHVLDGYMLDNLDSGKRNYDMIILGYKYGFYMVIVGVVIALIGSIVGLVIGSMRKKNPQNQYD